MFSCIHGLAGITSTDVRSTAKKALEEYTRQQSNKHSPLNRMKTGHPETLINNTYNKMQKNNNLPYILYWYTLKHLQHPNKYPSPEGKLVSYKSNVFLNLAHFGE